MNVEHDPKLDEQILSVLNDEWRNCFGNSFSLQRDTTLKQIVDYWNFSLSWWDMDALDLNDYLLCVTLKLGLTIEHEEWHHLLGQDLSEQSDSAWEEFAQDWTVQRLIDFLRERLPDVSFDPVNICGKDCAPAGAFFGLRDLVNHHRISLIRMGPSSKMTDILDRTAFLNFWRQLRLFTQDRVPQLIPRIRHWRILLSFGLRWTVIDTLVLFCGLALGFNWFWLIVPAAFATWFDWARLSEPDLGYLPPQFQTFRDLAEYVANQRAVV